MKGYTLKLDVGGWDLTLDETGKIATAHGAYAAAQNVANAQRLFIADAYFDQRRGVPHFETELGDKFAVAAPVLRTRMKKAALTVNAVKDASVALSYKDGRICGTTTTIKLHDGTTAIVEA